MNCDKPSGGFCSFSLTPELEEHRAAADQHGGRHPGA